jgi:aspartate 1-decarboxylase
MRRIMLKSKIHRATVSAADLHYAGSLTVDSDLLDAADIAEHEQVHVLNINSGARFETYAIAGERGSGELKVNGAAARLAQPGDIVIVLTFGVYEPEELAAYRPVVVQVDDANRAVGTAGASVGSVGNGHAPAVAPAGRLDGGGRRPGGA